jgi:hypothetical protein
MNKPFQPDLLNLDFAPVPQLPPDPKTVIAHLLARLLSGQTLTHLDAWILSHTSRLAAHIHRLKELGWSIAKTTEPTACGDGRTAYIARYKLIEPHYVVGDANVQAFVENVTQARLGGK